MKKIYLIVFTLAIFGNAFGATQLPEEIISSLSAPILIINEGLIFDGGTYHITLRDNKNKMLDIYFDNRIENPLKNQLCLIAYPGTQETLRIARYSEEEKSIIGILEGIIKDNRFELEQTSKKNNDMLKKILTDKITFLKKHNVIPKQGYVPDEETAIKIAIAVWSPIYGDEIKKQKPYKAVLENNIWHVSGTLPKNTLGGTAEAEIDKKTGQIIRISHGK